MTKQQPESLAQFAELSRQQAKAPDAGGKELTAGKHTKPIPTDPAKKQDAATRVLREGALHKDQGADEAIDKLPDRITQSR